MKYIYFTIFIVLANFSFACNERPVPIELEVKKYRHDSTYLIILKAPIKHEKFSLYGGQYRNGSNRV